MFFSRRVAALLLLYMCAALATLAEPPAALSVAPSPIALPAFLDIVTFQFEVDNTEHKVVVTAAPAALRVDELSDGYSVIFNPATEHYTGLEHRNYTWWEFSWPQVQAAVENSKRHATRLMDLSNQGLTGDSAVPATTAPALTSTSTDDDDSGYVWHASEERKRIADLDCVRWTGDTVSGENVEAWCVAEAVPKVQAAIERLRLINEPMALVPVRTVVPDFIFPVYRALAKGGVTPILINWGEAPNRNSFRLVDVRQHKAGTDLFTVPKLYMKTTLISMDGLIDQQPATEPHKPPPPKTWQNP